jgi:pyruvate/2-oxoglutarate dehydrogenase complex dihydrolipoamide acyltransferase (E2) component
VSSSLTDVAVLVDVLMPQMGTSVVEGTVLAWSVDVGQPVEADQVICEISTDKVDSECPSPVSGTLAEIVVAVGETVDVGAVIGRIATTGAVPTNGAAPPSPEVAVAPAAPASTTRVSAPANGRRYSPVVQRVAAHHEIDLALVTGTGRGGRVTKKDVLDHIAAGGDSASPDGERPLHTESPYRPDPVPPVAAPTAAAPVAARPDDLGGVAAPLSRMRQSIGAAMRRSLETAATCTTVVECDMSAIQRRRSELGLTALPLLARCTIETLREFPDLNATLDGTTITRYERVHLGIAVSLGDDGLMVPVIHDAQDLSPEGLGGRIRDVAKRTRAKKISPDELQGATFTITNPGQFGALIATPVIPLPQVAILDLEAIVKRPVVITDGDGNDAIAIRPMVNLCMGWDHRAIDGAYAAQFLTALRRRIEAV